MSLDTPSWRPNQGKVVIGGADVKFDAKTAIAFYDPAIANVMAIAEASAYVGFPAKAIQEPAP